jgi:hypothetical protein
LAFLLLAVVGVVLRTFKAMELHTLLTKDATLRQALGFGRVPYRRTLERRLDATLPEAEAQVQALGYQILAEVEPGPDKPQASAIDGRMYQAQGPLWHKRDRYQERIPPGLRNVDMESAWSKIGGSSGLDCGLGKPQSELDFWSGFSCRWRPECCVGSRSKAISLWTEYLCIGTPCHKSVHCPVMVSTSNRSAPWRIGQRTKGQLC